MTKHEKRALVLASILVITVVVSFSVMSATPRGVKETVKVERIINGNTAVVRKRDGSTSTVKLDGRTGYTSKRELERRLGKNRELDVRHVGRTWRGEEKVYIESMSR